MTTPTLIPSVPSARYESLDEGLSYPRICIQGRALPVVSVWRFGTLAYPFKLDLGVQPFTLVGHAGEYAFAPTADRQPRPRSCGVNPNSSRSSCRVSAASSHSSKVAC
jgi:hypothetical protein